MTSSERLLEVFREKISRENTGTIPAIVESVTDTTCSATLVESDILLDDIQLTANEGSRGLILVPKTKSIINIASIGNDDNTHYVAGVSELERVDIEIEKTKIIITKNGTKIENDGKSLKTILTNFVNAVAAIVVVQGVGPDIAKLNRLTEDINTVLV